MSTPLNDLVNDLSFVTHDQEGRYNFTYRSDREQAVLRRADLVALDSRLPTAVDTILHYNTSITASANALANTVALWRTPQSCYHYNGNTKSWCAWVYLETSEDRASISMNNYQGMTVGKTPVITGPLLVRQEPHSWRVWEQLHPGLQRACDLAQALGLTKEETAVYCHQQLYPSTEQLPAMPTLPDMSNIMLL